jgi:hypothetical protein
VGHLSHSYKEGAVTEITEKIFHDGRTQVQFNHNPNSSNSLKVFQGKTYRGQLKLTAETYPT